MYFNEGVHTSRHISKPHFSCGKFCHIFALFWLDLSQSGELQLIINVSEQWQFENDFRGNCLHLSAASVSKQKHSWYKVTSLWPTSVHLSWSTSFPPAYSPNCTSSAKCCGVFVSTRLPSWTVKWVSAVRVRLSRWCWVIHATSSCVGKCPKEEARQGPPVLTYGFKMFHAFANDTNQYPEVASARLFTLLPFSVW